MATRSIITHLVIVCAILFGLLCLCAPGRVQAYALKRNRYWLPGVPNPLLGRMSDSSFWIYLRAMGLLVLIVFGAVEVAMWLYPAESRYGGGGAYLGFFYR